MGYWRPSPEQRTFQLRAIFGVLFLVSLLYAVVTAGFGLARIFDGSITQASVVCVSDPYDSRGYRITIPRVDYEYYDPQANAFRRDVYWASSDEPRPALGQKLNVEFIPGHNLSWRISSDSRASHFWPIIPTLILGGLLGLSFHNENVRVRYR